MMGGKNYNFGDVLKTSNSSSKTRGAAAPRTRITWRLY